MSPNRKPLLVWFHVKSLFFINVEGQRTMGVRFLVCGQALPVLVCFLRSLFLCDILNLFLEFFRLSNDWREIKIGHVVENVQRIDFSLKRSLIHVNGIVVSIRIEFAVVRARQRRDFIK
uniref:Uncharacterized protein n=1 Tax=Rhizophora mucronata TaxID=61149 RepID=A0A2P2P061_RHIMU